MAALLRITALQHRVGFQAEGDSLLMVSWFPRALVPRGRLRANPRSLSLHQSGGLQASLIAAASFLMLPFESLYAPDHPGCPSRGFLYPLEESFSEKACELPPRPRQPLPRISEYLRLKGLPQTLSPERRALH